VWQQPFGGDDRSTAPKSRPISRRKLAYPPGLHSAPSISRLRGNASAVKAESRYNGSKDAGTERCRLPRAS